MTKSGMTNDSAGTPPVPGAELVFPTILGAGPSHVEIAMPDGTVVPAPTVRPVEQEAQVIRPALPSGPAGLQRLDTLDELSAQPDGTVVVWHYWTGWDYERQAGVLDTNSRGEREVRPVSIRIYECNTDLVEVDPPVWVLTFNDPDSASK